MTLDILQLRQVAAIGRYRRAGHPLLSRTVRAFADLEGFPFTINAVPARAARFFERIASAGRVDPMTGHFLPAITLDSVEFMWEMVRETDAVSWAPTALIDEELKAGTLVALPLQAPWARLNYGIIRRADRHSTPAIDTFLAELRSTEARLVQGQEPPRRRRRRS
jgi:DNA-binding transcriptional LysR family regulator